MNFACRNQNFIKPKLVTPKLRPFEFDAASARATAKCFTYVTKTCANLTTYSRKLENYNGTIIFEIDIMKNSSPINLNLGHT